MTLLSLLLINTLWANPCPQTLSEDSEIQQAHAWLERFAGSYELEGCQVEIRTCDLSLGSLAEPNHPYAEIWLQDASGREAYVSLEALPKASKRTQSQTRAYKRALHYQKRDLYPEPTNGRTEFWQVELQTHWENPDQLKSLDLGIYTTTTRLDQPNGNQSHWFNCGPNSGF